MSTPEKLPIPPPKPSPPSPKSDLREGWRPPLPAERPPGPPPPPPPTPERK